MVKRISILVLILILIIGLCYKCHRDKKEEEARIAFIKAETEERYGEEFKVEYFQPARDYTWPNVLTLSNEDGVIFNAYQYEDDTPGDDYIEALIDRKLADYIISSQNISSNLQVNVIGVVRDYSLLTMDYYENFDPTPANKDFIKIIIVISMKDDIKEYKDELFDIYQEILKYDTKVLEFEVVSYKKLNEKLTRILNNPLAYYNNHWDEYRGVKSYIDVRTRDIKSAEELMKQIKK